MKAAEYGYFLNGIANRIAIERKYANVQNRRVFKAGASVTANAHPYQSGISKILRHAAEKKSKKISKSVSFQPQRLKYRIFRAFAHQAHM